MNYIKIKKTALLFLASTSYLSATSTNMPTTTNGKLELITQHFLDIYQWQKSKPNVNQGTHQNKIATLRDEIKLLINSDQAIVNQRTPKFENTTITMQAVRLRYADIIDILSKRDQFNINIKDDDGNSAITWASFFGHTSILNLLLNTKGADINIQNKEGSTPLVVAAEKNHHGAIELLLNRGADITIKNNKKKTALDIAIEKLEKYLNNGTSVDKNISPSEKTLKIRVTKKIIELLKTARMYLYIRRALWALAAVLLLTLTGGGIHHYILEPRADA